jgi:hypothetical protein
MSDSDAAKVKLTFRAPATLRRAIKWGKSKLEVSQSHFVEIAVEEFIERIEIDEAISGLVLPEGFRISNKDNRMMGVNVRPEMIDVIDEYTHRFYHSRTRLILWAVALKALELAEENNS